MKLYLNQKIESIPIFDQLVTLLNNVKDNKKLIGQIRDVEDLYKVNHINDPVVEFIEFYNGSSRESDKKYNKDQIEYIKNALYAAKGAVKVLEVYEEVFEVKLTNVTYNFPKLDVVRFDTLYSTNTELFCTKLENMLYYLIYFTEINIYINHITTLLNGTLTTYNSGILLPFKRSIITENEIIIGY